MVKIFPQVSQNKNKRYKQRREITKTYCLFSVLLFSQFVIFLIRPFWQFVISCFLLRLTEIELWSKKLFYLLARGNNSCPHIVFLSFFTYSYEVLPYLRVALSKCGQKLLLAKTKFQVGYQTCCKGTTMQLQWVPSTHPYCVFTIFS